MKKKIIIIALIILLILLAVFTIFYLYATKEVKLDSYIYRDKFQFVKYEEANGEITHTLLLVAGPSQDKLKLYKIPFRYNPYDLENVSMDSGIRNKILSSKGFYITLDPDYDVKSVVAAADLSNVLSTADFSIFKFPLESAFTKEREGYDKKVIDCSNATKDIKVIKLELGNKTRVYSEGNCIIVEGDSYDNMIKAAERLSLNLLTSF